MQKAKEQKKVIYIADDDRAIVDALKFMLERMGYEVDGAYDSTVVTKIMTKKPDLLLLDIWMSGSDGRDICMRLKRDTETKDVPIVMISAHPDAGSISKQCGADDFLSKPFGAGELLSKVQANIA